MPPQQPDGTILKRIKARFAVELHPSKLENVTEGVREQLNASLLRCGPPPPGHHRPLPARPCSSRPRLRVMRCLQTAPLPSRELAV